jgi:methylthioxylose transferase
MTGTAAPAQAPPRRRHGDILVLAAQAVLVGCAVVVGAALNRRRVPIHADAAPLFATWLPHIGPGTPVAIAVAVLVMYRGPDRAARLPWRHLMIGTYLAALAWTLSLALIDGWSRGLATRLTPQAEYLHDVPKVTSIPAMLSGFTSHIPDFRPLSWATHVAGHPPGALLVFVLLDRIGLGGGAPAALLCVLIGAAAPVAVAATLRALADEPAARTVLPFLVLFPGAVWVGASADGLFAGVVAAGLALLAVGGWRLAAVGGLLLGLSLYLSYGLILAGPLALAVIALKPRYRWATAIAGTTGVVAVGVTFTAAGFWWPTGYRLVVQRYYQGWAADRPYGYWVWANLACLVVSAGPAALPALRRAFSVARVAAGRSPAFWLPALALFAIVAADLSGLSKAEVERIWLPYEIWLIPATAWLPATHHRRWLGVQALTALAVNHLLLTNW